MNLGTVYFNQNFPKKALKYYKKAIEIDPNFFYAYYNLGNFYLKYNQLSKAKSSYEKALEIDPNNKIIQMILEEWDYISSDKYRKERKKMEEKLSKEKG